MESWVQIVLAFIGLLGGGGLVVSALFFRKATKRLKTAEAYSAEFDGLSKTCSELRSQIEFLNGRMNAMQELNINKDVYIGTLSNDKHVLEVKHAKNKSAINKAHECSFCDSPSTECVVLIQRTKNEEEYLRMVERQNKK